MNLCRTGSGLFYPLSDKTSVVGNLQITWLIKADIVVVSNCVQNACIWTTLYNMNVLHLNSKYYISAGRTVLTINIWHKYTNMFNMLKSVLTVRIYDSCATIHCDKLFLFNSGTRSKHNSTL